MATPTFLTAVNVSDPGQDGFEPQVAQDGSGNVFTVYTRSDGTNFRVQYATRTAAGSWSAPVTLSDPGQGASSPQIASDSAGNAVAVWTRSDGTNLRIQAAYKPAGGAFGAPVTVSAALGDASAPQVSMDATGKAIVVWQRFDGTKLRVQAAIRSAGAGGSFGATTTLSAPGSDAFEPQVAAGNDVDSNASICWTRSDGTNLRVQCARRRDVTGFPRPKGAGPTRMALVPAFNTCAAPNKVHAPPLAFGSCSPATASSSTLTMGSPDTNGFVANAVDFVKYQVINGNANTEANEADVRIGVGLTDVRTNPAGLDYTGKVLVSSNLTITDQLNSAEAPEPGTVSTFKFEFPVQCTSTVSTTIGSDCITTTTANSLIPGMVTESRRTVWAFGQIVVKDAGPNGTGYGASCPPTCGDGDETEYLRQGIYAP